MATQATPTDDKQAVEIDVLSGKEETPDAGEIDIPQLTAPEFGTKEARQKTLEAADILEDYEPAESEIDSEDETGEEVEKKIVEKVRKTRGPNKKVIKSPAARARVLEKEKAQIKEQRDREVEDLTIKVNRLYNELTNMVQAQQQAELQRQQEEPVDEELDPQGAQAQKLALMQQEIENLRQERLAEANAETIRQAVNAANNLVKHYVEQDPVNQAAMDHLSDVIEKRADQVLPHLTTKERVAAVGKWIAEQKVQWIAQGMHPGEQLVNMAYEYGFNPDDYELGAEESEEEETPTIPIVQDKNRREIAVSRERASKTNTLSNVVGKSPSRLNATDLKQMNSDEFNRTVDRMIQAGQWNRGGSIGRTPPLSQLMPGKAINV